MHTHTHTHLYRTRMVYCVSSDTLRTTCLEELVHGSEKSRPTHATVNQPSNEGPSSENLSLETTSMLRFNIAWKTTYVLPTRVSLFSADLRGTLAPHLPQRHRTDLLNISNFLQHEQKPGAQLQSIRQKRVIASAR